MEDKAYFHLPGLFEFYEFYKVFLPFFYNHRDLFFSWCEIGSIYGAPSDAIWNGGRESIGMTKCKDVIELIRKYNISPRLTFSNSLLEEAHLLDKRCNKIADEFSKIANTGIIIHSDLLLKYLKGKYPSFYFISSTTKVLTDPNDFMNEINNEDYRYVVPDFRLNKKFDVLSKIPREKVEKVEFLLTYINKRKDTNVLAHDLIDRFKNLAGILDASYEELISVKGVGKLTATFLTTLPQYFNVYTEEKNNNKYKCLTFTDVFDYFSQTFCPYNNEVALLSIVDNKNYITNTFVIGKGNMFETEIDTSLISNIIVKHNAKKVILAHNHPNGKAQPSARDLDTNSQILNFLKLLKVELVDNIILDNNGLYSFNNKQYIQIK